MKGQHGANRLAQAAFGPISHHRPADAARCGESGADKWRAVGALKGLNDNSTASAGDPLRGGEEFGPLAQTLDLWGGGLGQAGSLLG
jgi:hypothetical protein